MVEQLRRARIEKSHLQVSRYGRVAFWEIVLRWKGITDRPGTCYHDCLGGNVMTEIVANNERILAVLHALITRTEAIGVRELASALESSRSTINRILLGLTEHGLAVASPQGTYTCGPRISVLACALQDRHPLFALGRTLTEDLSVKTGATALMAVHDAMHRQAVVLTSHSQPGPVAYSLDPGTELPLHAGATGRAILTRTGIEALGQLPLEPRTAETVTDYEELGKLLRHDRKVGYTISVGHQFPLAAGAAAPFAFGNLIGSVSITRPTYSTSDEDLTVFGHMVRQASDQISSSHATDVSLQSTDRITNPAGATALERVVRLLTALCTSPLSVSSGKSLASRINGNPATTNRLVSSLVAVGLATEDAGVLQAGPRLLHWAALLGPQLDFSSMARPILENLSRETGETIGLSEYSRESANAEMTLVINGVKPLHYRLASNVPIPLHAGSAGKSILAFCDERVLASVPLDPLTEKTPVNRKDLAKDLAEIRERGWAIGHGERLPDAFGISAPIFQDRVIAGSVTATIAQVRLPETDLDLLIESVQGAAAQITRLLSVE
ncbi:IclR family transcriptional regulator [Glutamicibacter sp. NPDC087661]|uniref:IclR family transcriptional regulator n=1 Tax=Glutamicibacter sp. NPDC087661 TaxID=3363996 RepID=UPI00381644EC